MVLASRSSLFLSFSLALAVTLTPLTLYGCLLRLLPFGVRKGSMAFSMTSFSPSSLRVRPVCN